MDTIKDLRTASGMTQKAFSDYFGIPKRTIENWEGGKRECPPYLYNLMRYKMERENLIDTKHIGTEEYPCGISTKKQKAFQD